MTAAAAAEKGWSSRKQTEARIPESNLQSHFEYAGARARFQCMTIYKRLFFQWGCIDNVFLTNKRVPYEC